MNKDSLAGSHVSGMVQQFVSSDPIKDQRYSSLRIDSFGHAHEKAFGEVDELCLSFVLGKTCNAIADFELRATLTIEAHLAENTIYSQV